MEHISDDHGVFESVSRRLEPGEQISGDDLGVRGVIGQQRRCRATITALSHGDDQRGIETHKRGEELPATRVSRSVVITVSSIPTLVGRTAATRSAADTTARITVFHPTPNCRRIVSTGTFSCDAATAARAAARLQTAPGAIEAVRSTNVPQPSTHLSSRLRHTTRVARPARGR